MAKHFIALELRAYLSYSRNPLPLTYWRTTSQFEIDFIIGKKLAIEVNGTDMVADRHMKGLHALAEEGLIKDLIVVSCDPNYRRTQKGIQIY